MYFKEKGYTFRVRGVGVTVQTAFASLILFLFRAEAFSEGSWCTG